MPDEQEEAPQDAIHFAAVTTFSVRFECHGKRMEVMHDDDRHFRLSCDLCGKSIQGIVGEDS